MKHALALAVAGLALCGCTLEPHYVRPVPAIPAAWPKGEAYPPAAAEPAPTLSYRDLFKDPHLLALIDQALAGNQNLRVAMANVEVARAQYRVQRADLFPSLDAGAAAGQSRSRSTSTGAVGVQRSYQGDLAAAFEIDLFGRLRSLSHEAQEQYLATAAGARAARLTLVGEVAQAYLTLAADRTLLAISADTVASAARTVALTQARLEGGVAARTDLAQAQTLMEQARSDQAQLTTQVAQDRNALELLVGGRVADDLLPEAIEAVDGQLGEAPAGLDSRILLRRPDVAEAEHALRAANAQIGAARAAFFPTISLTGLAGYASPQLGGLFAGRNATWQAQSAANLPIFTGGANVAGLAGAKASREAAVANYQLAVQSAFRNVADALARRGTIDQQLAAQQALSAAAATSYQLSDARYRAGVDPYLDALVSQRTLYSARQSLTQTRLARAQNLVALYEALGGDAAIDALPVGGPALRN
ncbi:efflux transporter outer membrane subunit [Phenylobacterium sp. LjRoot225]|uniref:efflux transporter outer membrane subunit n=1 Tax=Phenylobacterium sp. LjRoot225 TaxID=3342285 RepID=UPI003ED08AEA